ncbi:MAG: saccharopine dehydrogenase NADP-binding domain-containing protein [Kofleriaceae bacterium]
MRSGPDIVVYGATGLTGRRACAELEATGTAFAIAGRDPAKLAELGAQFPAAAVRVATIDDAAALARTFGDATVVLNCAGPASDTNEPVLAAALAAGAHYVDLGGDQAFVHGAYERHESAARRAGRVAIIGAGVDCVLGDWAAAWAAAYVCGLARDADADVVRTVPLQRVAEDRPLDDVAVTYVFDDLVLSPAGQRAAFAGLHARGLVWHRDRWERVAPAGERRRVNAGIALGGEREAVSFPGGDVITIPRHLAAHHVQTFASTSRKSATMTALRLLARAVPFVPKRATDLLAAYEPSDAEYARTRFAVIAQARRGFSAAQVGVRGHDLYRTSAIVATWIARQLVARSTGPVGMRAPSELFRPEPALREVAEAAGLVVEPSFA